jgi:DNA-binding MarR family transcriptional regulator
VGEPDLMTLTRQLGQVTRRAMAMHMAGERWAIEAGFRPGCLGVLQIVAGAPDPVSQREVSERLLFDPSDVVSLVDILERAGLVERRRDPSDRRRYALHITEAGQQAAQRLEVVAREAHEHVLAPLDPTEREALAHLLGRVVSHHLGGDSLSWVDLTEEAARARATEPAPHPAGS